MTIVSDVTGFWSGSISYQPQPWATSPLVINFGSGPDENNIAWVWESITGWDSPDVSGSIVQRSADHGGWPTSQYYAPRVMTITMDALCPDNATRDLARAVLQQIIPINDLATFQFNESVPKIFYARRTGQIKETLPNLTDAVFNIAITAPDPRKYGSVLRVAPTTVIVPETYFTIGSVGSNSTIGNTTYMPVSITPGVIELTNFGTFETRPVITVTGPVQNPGLRNRLTGQIVSWTGTALNTGDQLVVNFDAKSAYLNGAYWPADITSAWWTIWPGPNVIELLGMPGSAGSLMSIVYRDAYI